MIRYRRAILAGIILFLSGLACSRASEADLRKWTPTPSSSPAPTSTPILASDTARAEPSPIRAESPIPTSTPILATIAAVQSVNMRAEPDPGSASLGVLYSGAPIELTGICSGEWAEIKLGAGRAWIRSRYISSDPCKGSR